MNSHGRPMKRLPPPARASARECDAGNYGREAWTVAEAEPQMTGSDRRVPEPAHRVTFAERLVKIGRRVNVQARAHASQLRTIWQRAGTGKLWHSPNLQWVAALWSPRQSAWILSLTGAFAATLAGMFFWMAWHSRQIVVADTYNSSSNLALSVEQFVGRTMETVDLTLRVVVEEIGAGAAITPQEIQTLLRERVRQSPALTTLLVTGPDGHVRFSSVRLPPRSVNLANKDYFVSARDSAALQLSVGASLMPGEHGRQVIFVSRRFNRTDGKSAGVVIATLNPDYVQRFFSTLHVGQDDIIALDRIDGTLLVGRPFRDSDVGKNFSASPLFREMLPWASSGVFPRHYETDGLWRIVAYQRLASFPMVVEVALSQDGALVNWRRTTRIQAAVGAAILMAFGFMAFVLNRQLDARALAHRRLEETVDELTKARLAAEDASRAKGQFLANMSHELRTPLNAVIGYSEMLLEDAEGDGSKVQQVADLRRIHSAGKHLLSLVTDVLDLSKIEAGKMDLSADPFVLDPFIDDVAATCRPLVEEKGNEFIVRRSGDLGTVVGDVTKLRQAILNLLSNAGKFTENGIVMLQAMRDKTGAGDWICLSVRDTGIGISRENLPNLFQNFGQVDARVARKYGGTGLGLALSQKLCRMMGGDITVESQPGLGSCFTIRIPATLTGQASV